MTLDEAITDATARLRVGAASEIETWVVEALDVAGECGFVVPSVKAPRSIDPTGSQSRPSEYLVEISDDTVGYYTSAEARAFFAAGLRACDEAEARNRAAAIASPATAPAAPGSLESTSP